MQNEMDVAIDVDGITDVLSEIIHCFVAWPTIQRNRNDVNVLLIFGIFITDYVA